MAHIDRRILQSPKAIHVWGWRKVGSGRTEASGRGLRRVPSTCGAHRPTEILGSYKAPNPSIYGLEERWDLAKEKAP